MNKQDALDYIKQTDLNFQGARAGYLQADFVFTAYMTVRLDDGSSASPMFFYMPSSESPVFYQIWSNAIIDSIMQETYKRYLNDPSTLKKTMGEHVRLAGEIRNLMNDLDWEEDSIKQVIERFIDLSIRWWRLAAIGEDKGRILERSIIPRFAKDKGISIEEAKERFKLFAHPEEHAVFTQERIDFLQICLEEDPAELINDYISKYAWIRTDFYDADQIDEEWVVQQRQEQLKGSSKKEIEAEQRSILDDHHSRSVRREAIMQEMDLSEQDIKDIEFAQATTLWVDLRKEGMMWDLYFFQRLMKVVSERKGIEYHTLTRYKLKEFISLVKEDKEVSQDEIQKRKGPTFVVFHDHDADRFLFGSDAEELFAEIVKGQKSDEMKGMVASKGGKETITGVVSLIFDPKNQEFKPGTILVTTMTRVEFLPIMKKALAIITDEGGISCHASIVSRELGIPCIVGTKHATQTLEDGQTVTLDLKDGKVIIP